MSDRLFCNNQYKGDAICYVTFAQTGTFKFVRINNVVEYYFAFLLKLQAVRKHFYRLLKVRNVS